MNLKKLKPGERQRGRYAGMQNLYTGSIEKAPDEIKAMLDASHQSSSLKVVIDNELREIFPTEQAVNEALRTLVRLYASREKSLHEQ